MAFILVVESEPAVNKTVCNILDYLGHKPASVDSGKSATKMFLKHHFNLIVISSMLPDYHLNNLLDIIIKTQKEAGVLILSTGNDIDDLKNISNGENICFLLKPFAISLFCNKVDSILDSTCSIKTKQFQT